MRSTPRLGFVLVVCVLGACASDLDGRLSEGTDSAPAVAEDQRAAARLTVAEFRGSWDPVSGVFDVEVVEPAASALGVEVEPFREFDQALYCEPRRTYGFSDTIGLVTVAGSIGTSAGACGFGGFPYDILGGFCATIRVSSYYTSLSLTSVTAEIVAVNPPEYTGYEYPLGTGADPTGGDPVRGIAQGDGQPTDAGGGLFLHGEIVPGGVAETMWMFRNPGGAFEFSGRIMAGVVEADNDLDDNCDGWIDDRLGEYADEADCRFDIDCQSGLCHDIDTGTAIGDCAETCSEGRYGDPCVDCPGGSGDAQCSGNGTCDDGAPGTGVCTCATNFAGADCSACVPDHFGPACDPCPECLNSGVCGDGSGGSGACVCPTGVHGDVCEFTCADGVANGAEEGIDCGGPCPACSGCVPHGSTTSATLGFEMDFIDLDTGVVTRDDFMGGGPENDLNIAYNAGRPVHSVVFQQFGREIAHLTGVAYADVTGCDVAGAAFTTSLIDISFDPGRVILVRTDTGAVFKMGNPVEGDTLTFDFAELLDCCTE